MTHNPNGLGLELRGSERGLQPNAVGVSLDLQNTPIFERKRTDFGALELKNVDKPPHNVLNGRFF